MIGLIAFSDLLQSKKLEDWKQSIVNTSTMVGLRASNWIEGGFTRTLIALFTQLYKTSGDVVRLIAGSAFLDTSAGDWLELVAAQVFGVQKIHATFASAEGGITLTNTGGGFYTFDPGDLVFAHSITGATYRNTSGGTLFPGVGETLDLDIEAEAAGSGSNAIVGTITVLVTTPLGITVSNFLPLVGIDQETDAALRQRCRDSLAAQSIGGIKKAYEYFARTAKRTDGRAIGITRVQVMPPPGDGTLTVYIAEAGGAVTSDDVALVQAAFDAKVTPTGFNATAVSATNLPVTAPCTIWIPSTGMTDAAARKAVSDALQAYVQTLPIGGVIIAPATGKIFWRAILGVIEKSIDGMLKAQLTTEADVDVAAGQVPIWSGVLTDTTVIQVTT